MASKKQPLSIAVAVEWLDRPEIQALKAKGHNISTVYHGDFDAVLSPVSHMFTDDMWEMLPVVIKAAEKRRKAKDG